MVSRSSAADQLGAALRTIVSSGGIVPLYQPMFDLDEERLAAVEALARGPRGPLHLPAALFGAAEAAGLVSELDQACREAAFRGVIGHGLPTGVTLFVNVEPAHLGAAPSAELVELEGALRG